MMSSSDLLKRRIVDDASVSNDHGEYKRAKSLMEDREDEERGQEIKEILKDELDTLSKATLDDSCATEAITPSPMTNDDNEDGSNNRCQEQGVAEDETTGAYAWARKFLNDLTQIMSVSAAEMHKLMLEHCENVQVPSEAIIDKWMTENRRNASRKERGDSGGVSAAPESAPRKHLVKKGSRFFESADSIGKHAWLLKHGKPIEGSKNLTKPPEKATVDIYTSKKKPGKLTYENRDYFNKFSEKDQMDSASGRIVQNLIQQGTVEKWLAAERKQVGKSRTVGGYNKWVRDYLSSLMDEKGHTDSASAAAIRNIIQQNCNIESVPTRSSMESCNTENYKRARDHLQQLIDMRRMEHAPGATIHNHAQRNCWIDPAPIQDTANQRLAVERKQAGKSGASGDNYWWARDQFNKLMDEGHIDSPIPKVYKLIKNSCGDEPVPTHGAVENWLTAKRRQHYRWARSYLSKLGEEGHIDLSATVIHYLMRLNCGIEPVPPKRFVVRWLVAMRKEIAKSCPSGEECID